MNSKLPRLSKKDFSTQVFNKELFKKFKKEFPEYKDMTWEFFQESWLEIAKTIRSEAIINPLGVKLSSYLGEIKTQFLPYDFESTDIEKFNENKKKKYLNILTRGKIAKIKWERRDAVRFNRMLQFYGFEPHRDMNQLAKKYVPENVDKIRISRVTLGGKRSWI